MRTYKTESGTYTEDELSIVVWRNPKQKTGKQVRALETMTSEKSSYPMAFPTKSFIRNRTWAAAVRVSSMEEAIEAVATSSRAKPVVVPLPVAKQTFGWDNFYVPSEYVE